MSEPLLPPGGAETLLFVFATMEGTWMLDDMIDFSLVPLVRDEQDTSAP